MCAGTKLLLVGRNAKSTAGRDERIGSGLMMGMHWSEVGGFDNQAAAHDGGGEADP